MPCNRYVLIDREAEVKYTNNGTFDGMIKAPTVAALRQQGCTGDNVLRVLKWNPYTQELDACLECKDEKCFPEKIEPNPQKS